MPANIDGLQSGGPNIRLGFPQRQAPPPPESEEKEKKNCQSCESNSVLLQLHSDLHLLCFLLVLMPADCGWPCLAPEELVCCHFCTLTGSKAGTEGPKIFDDQWSKKKERKPSGGMAFILSLCISLSRSIFLVMMMRSKQQHWIHWIIDESSELNCMPHKRGFVFLAHKQAAHQKYSFRSFTCTIYPQVMPRCACLCATCACVWEWECCVIVYLSSCVGKIASVPGDTSETSNMGAMQGIPWENVRLACPWIPAFLSHPPTLPQSQFNPVITQSNQGKAFEWRAAEQKAVKPERKLLITMDLLYFLSMQV